MNSTVIRKKNNTCAATSRRVGKIATSIEIPPVGAETEEKSMVETSTPGSKDRVFGPNARRLLSRFIAAEAIPPNTGIRYGLKFFQGQEHRKGVVERATINFDTAIQAVRLAPDNPYGEDEDAIAAGILKELEKFEARRDGK